MSIIEREPGTEVQLPYRANGKVENVKIEANGKLADIATATTSIVSTETIDGMVYGTLESIAAEVRPIPVIGPALARALTRTASLILKGGKAPSSSQQNQSMLHMAKLLHSLAVLVDATAYWIGDFSEAVYNNFSTLVHQVMPAYVETQVKPVRVKATTALELAQKDDASIKAGLAAINSLAASLPWAFHAGTFAQGMSVWVGLFTRLWRKVYDNIELRLGRIEGTDLPEIRGLLTKLSNFVHGSLVPDITKLKQQMLETLTKTIPGIKAKQAVDEQSIAKINNVTIPAVQAKQKTDEATIAQQGLILLALGPLLTPGGFASAFGNAAANATNRDTQICSPVTECVGNNILSKGGWSWLKGLLPAILAGAIDALLLADMCLICTAARALVTAVEPELRGIAYLEGRLVDSGCGSLPPSMPSPAYS